MDASSCMMIQLKTGSELKNVKHVKKNESEQINGWLKTNMNEAISWRRTRERRRYMLGLNQSQHC